MGFSCGSFLEIMSCGVPHLPFRLGILGKSSLVPIGPAGLQPKNLRIISLDECKYIGKPSDEYIWDIYMGYTHIARNPTECWTKIGFRHGSTNPSP